MKLAKFESASYEEIIKLAACPHCAAYIGEPCRFTRPEDPYNRRAAIRQSHDARVIIANRRVWEGTEKIRQIEKKVAKQLDSIRL